MARMKAGKYWIGDLCYVMHDEWDEFCSLTIKGHECLDGKFQLEDSREFVTYRTMYGDGVYEDNYGKCYGVDAGLIGCIRVEDIREGVSELGHVHTFPADFDTGRTENGTIHFGHVTIKTD